MPAMTDVTVEALQVASGDQQDSFGDLALSDRWGTSAAVSDLRDQTVLDTMTSVAESSKPTSTWQNDSGDQSQAGGHNSPVFLSELDQPSLFVAPYCDIKDSKAIQGVAGLRNLGNTCFMNAGLQCLASIPRLAHFFLEHFEFHKTLQETLTGQFADLLGKIWSGEYTVVHPSQFKGTLGMYHPHFSDFRQHDCQEFLALLLDSLHEQLNTAQEAQKTWDMETSNSTWTMAPSSQAADSCCEKPDFNNALTFKAELNNARAENPEPSAEKSNWSPDVQEASAESETAGQDLETSPEEGSMPAEVVIPSEDSNQSQISVHTAEAVSHRQEAVPEAVQPFQYPERLEGAADVEMENDGQRKLPSLEDLYMKDTKTLNTNVVATEYMDEEVATDSDKFHKADNRSRSPQHAAELFNNFEQLNDLLAYNASKDASLKAVKDTNLLANVKDKFADDCYSEKCLFSEVVGATACEPRDSLQKKLLYSQLGVDDANCGINNIKRMKIDEDEKNLRMQALRKVNTDKNPTNICSNLTLRSPVADRDHSVTSERDLSLSQQGAGREHAVILPNQLHDRDVKEADRAWRKHLSSNQSVIVETFQGQFKSTVVCAECQHISVTYEPFMYLSVPLPHAMERQISVLFVPCDNKQPVRYLLTLNKQDRVSKLKLVLVQMIGEETCDLIMAEVFDNHISRILEDNTMLRYVNDSSRTVYAIEMMPPPQLDDVGTEASEVVLGAGDVSSSSDVPPNNMTSLTSKPKPEQDDVFANMGSFLVESDGWESWSRKNCDVSAGGRTLEFEPNILNDLPDSSSASINRWTGYQENTLVATADSTSTSIQDPSQADTGVETWQATMDTQAGSTSGNWDVEAAMLQPTDGGGDAKVKAQVADTHTGSDEMVEAVKTDEWRSCAICLEEMADCDLMVHTVCEGSLCQSCLEMSFKHYGDIAFSCPVCSSSVSPFEDFIPLNSMANYKPKTRILSVPVVHRMDESKEKMQLFGHPNILYLPSTMSGEFLYESVDRVVSCLAPYNIILTDGQGYHCSRCLYTEHCSGCELPRDAMEVQLQPGDNLAVRFADLTPEQMDSCYSLTDHKSMADLRSSEPLTLFDCFTAFTERERLDEHNPWFCPSCKANQCANKTMTVWRYPETLVVYLKRFVFHDLASTKIDSQVVFPFENLDLTDYVSGPCTDGLLYDLQACVCHCGGASAGHYTAYSKHPVTNVWHFFNDETQSEQKPLDCDYSNAYILFYQKQGTKVNFTMPEKTSTCDDGHVGSLDRPKSVEGGPLPLQSEQLGAASVHCVHKSLQQVDLENLNANDLKDSEGAEPKEDSARHSDFFRDFRQF